MRLVNPAVERLNVTSQPLISIEKAGRTCYKSEDAITDSSAIDFVRKILARGHESVIEHASMSMRFICDRGVTHEFVRHRLFSYSQECLTGDTKVHKNHTIKELYDRQEFGSPQDKTHNKTLRLKSVTHEGVIVPNKIKKVLFKGGQQVYRVVTKLGYIITATKNHKFLDQENRYTRLKQLRVGDLIYTNGAPCLLSISDELLTEEYKTLSPQEIADEHGVPYRSVLRRLQNLNIFKPRKNDKHPEKYNRNHTPKSYTKMQQTVVKQYQEGREPWNKGLKEGDHPSIDKQAKILRCHHHDNGLGKDNSNWKGGPQGRIEAQQKKQHIKKCELCEDTKTLEVHHKDKDIKNNSDENIIKLCSKCHKMLENGWHLATRVQLDEIVSIEYAGIEPTFDLSMEDPYHNYIANGFAVHNSTRYCNYAGKDMEFVIPSWADILPDTYVEFDYHESLKRGRPEAIWMEACRLSEGQYNQLISLGWTPQQARSVLPNSLKTEIVVTGNFREWRHFFKLRCHHTAHPDMQKVAKYALSAAQAEVPVIFDGLNG